MDGEIDHRLVVRIARVHHVGGRIRDHDPPSVEAFQGNFDLCIGDLWILRPHGRAHQHVFPLTAQAGADEDGHLLLVELLKSSGGWPQRVDGSLEHDSRVEDDNWLRLVTHPPFGSQARRSAR